MSEQEKVVVEKTEDRFLYEVAFNILPTLGEEEASSEYADIVSKIESLGAKTLSKESPKLITLAYDMSKAISGKKHWFETAHFGSVICEAERETVLKIKNLLTLNEKILRHLIVEVPQEALIPRERKMTGKPIEKMEVKEDEKGPMVEEEVDKAIEELVAE